MSDPTLDAAPLAFVSYSHDSPAHKENVRQLVHRLRDDGIDCHVDQYEEFPPEGWPSWMIRQIRSADFVLVICTQPYFNRVTGLAPKGVGRGAKWEGALITQELYNAEGRNDRFVPVILDQADATFIPPFLEPYTYYDVSDDGGYDRLYRLLTKQPSVPLPPLGRIRSLGPAAPATRPGSGTRSVNAKRDAMARSYDSLLLIQARESEVQFVRADTVEIADEITVVASPINDAGRVFLAGLRGTRGTLALAHKLSAMKGRIIDLRQVLKDGLETFHFRLSPEPIGGSSFEMAAPGYSTDAIAELRARRILLNESPGPAHQRTQGGTDGSTLEVLIRGVGNQHFSVSESPLPRLYKEIGEDRDLFLQAARLVAVLWLNLSSTVAHVVQLDLWMDLEAELNVRFEGQRAKHFANAEPHRFRVEGVCQLRP